VPATGARFSLDLTVIIKTLQDIELGLRLFSITPIDNGAMPPVGVCLERQLHNFLVPFWASKNEGLIDFLHPSALKLCVQFLVCSSIPCQNHHPAHLMIQAVDNLKHSLC